MAHSMAQKYRLICFDLDGTLIEENQGKQYWETLHSELLGEEGERNCRERIRLFAEGRIDYKEWVELDMTNFKKAGKTKADFERAARLHRPMTGALELLAELQRRGFKLAVISGSVDILLETLFPEHPFDDLFLNEVRFNEDGTIASWKETLYDQGTKQKALHAICEREGIDLAHTVFVGDNENDCDILKEAGLGIAFMPKSPKVAAAADVVIEKADMREILQHLGE